MTIQIQLDEEAVYLLEQSISAVHALTELITTSRAEGLDVNEVGCLHQPHADALTEVCEKIRESTANRKNE